MDPIEYPECIWLKIFRKCDVTDLDSLSLTCTHFKNILDSSYIWKQKLKELWEVYEDICLDDDIYNFEEVKNNDDLNFKQICLRLKSLSRLERPLICFYIRRILNIDHKWISLMQDYAYKQRHPSTLVIESTPEEWALRCYKCYNTTNVFMTNLQNDQLPILNKLAEDSHLYWQHLDLTLPPVESKSWQLPIWPLNVAEALTQPSCFPIVREYLRHILQFRHQVQHSNTIIIVCEPLKMNHEVRIQLVKFLLIDMALYRVLLVPSPVLMSHAHYTETCLIIDSRTYTTTVCIVQNNQLISWRLIPIGGWFLSTKLYEAFCTRDNNTAVQYKLKTVHFDHWRIKTYCRLCMNFELEWNRPYATKLFTQILLDKKERTIKLGQELISGPEITYANMDLVKVIRELIDPLQKDHKADCLRNIFLMGGNCKLNGFKERLARDLDKEFSADEDQSLKYFIQVSLLGVNRDFLQNEALFSFDSRRYNSTRISVLKRSDYIIHGDNIFNLEY